MIDEANPTLVWAASYMLCGLFASYNFFDSIYDVVAARLDNGSTAIIHATALLSTVVAALLFLYALVGLRLGAIMLLRGIEGTWDQFTISLVLMDLLVLLAVIAQTAYRWYARILWLREKQLAVEVLGKEG